MTLSSPWQKGRCERHGGWIKTRVKTELQSGSSVIKTAPKLEMLIIQLVSHKNRWFQRGGYSPYQLTFGVSPKVLIELLSDDGLQASGLCDISADDFEKDSPAVEFSRSHEIRQKARNFCMQTMAKSKIQLSQQPHVHRQRDWARGQWVFVWRKFSGSDRAM